MIHFFTSNSVYIRTSIGIDCTSCHHYRDVKPANMVQTTAADNVTKLSYKSTSLASTNKKMSETFAAAIEASKQKSSNLSNTWIKQEFLAVANERSGALNFETFLQTNFATHLSEEDAKVAFDRLDLDKNGSIDIKEWTAGLGSLEFQLNILKPGETHGNEKSVVKSELGFVDGDMKRINASVISNSIARISAMGSTLTLKHTTTRYKLIDLGTAIAVSDAAGDSMNTASSSMIKFTAMDFAGKEDSTLPFDDSFFCKYS
jgi:hypothetical protein